MELEPIEPTERGFAALRQFFEPLGAVDAAVVTDHDCGRVDEGNAGGGALVLVQVDTERHQHRREESHEA